MIGAPSPRFSQPKGGRVAAFAGNDLWLQADPEAPAIGDTVFVDLRGGEPGLLGLIAWIDFDGVEVFQALQVVSFDSNGELQFCGDADPSLSGMEFTLIGYAQNRAGRGPLYDSSAVTIVVP